MAKLSDAQQLVKSLESITISELLDLSEEETVRLAFAFEAFVDKITEVVSRAANQNKQAVN